ncbi:hypothetical protein MIMGU_mgv1a017546mg [Erythranthe guttata]|uniref:Uncharacterized protein n=1 Tax=Erythranthe guttata TaxID=4155 RepID=A0A022PSV8_ERYGU|nr:hypothetical protein MIMGU_mgv1a017546mg [Erythranthe guttata]
MIPDLSPFRRVRRESRACGDRGRFLECSTCETPGPVNPVRFVRCPDPFCTEDGAKLAALRRSNGDAEI